MGLTARDEFIARLDAIQLQTWPGVSDIEWTPAGPRCADCSRLMRRWGRGWICGCGRFIKAEVGTVQCR